MESDRESRTDKRNKLRSDKETRQHKDVRDSPSSNTKAREDAVKIKQKRKWLQSKLKSKRESTTDIRDKSKSNIETKRQRDVQNRLSNNNEAGKDVVKIK